MIGVGVQLERRAKSDAAVSGTDVKDVAGIAVARVARGIDKANYAVVGGGLTPAHVPPISRTVVHRGEEAGRATARAGKCGTCVGIGPCVAAIGGTIDFVSPVAKAPTHLVHASDVDVARDLIARDLNITDEGCGDRYGGVPGSAVITGIGDAKSSTTNIEIVIGNVHPVREGRGRVIIDPSGIPVIIRIGVNTEMGPAIGVRGIGRFVAAQALTAACRVQPNGKPGAGRAVIKNNRIAQRPTERAVAGHAGERTVCAGDTRERGSAIG